MRQHRVQISGRCWFRYWLTRVLQPCVRADPGGGAADPDAHVDYDPLPKQEEA